MKAKIEEKRMARKLREKGWSVPRIAQELDVSEGSASAWTRDIKLSTAQKAAIEKRSRGLWREKWRQQWRDKRKVHQEDGGQLARQGNQLHVIGCMLHWAEGSKRRNNVVFANSDVDMMRLFVRFLRECYGVESSEIKMRVSCHLDHGLSMKRIESWWLQNLGLPRSSVTKGTIVELGRAGKRKKRKKLKYGICTVQVDRTEIVQSIFGAIQEYGGFENEKWLDC